MSESKQSLTAKYGTNKRDRELYKRAVEWGKTHPLPPSPLTDLFRSIQKRRLAKEQQP